MSEPHAPSIEPNAESPPTDITSKQRREHDGTAVDILAAKILIDWLRNRQQLLVPFTLDLNKLQPGEVEMVLNAMVAAAQADGMLDGTERERVEGALQLLNAREAERTMVAAMIDHPKPLAEIVAEVQDVKTGAIVYAASLLAIDQRKRVNRYYLRYLAARLQLPQEVTRTLEQRFRAAV